jgi:TetR/AcrR family transcriptional regulator, transcriptional repressor for nem operon
VNTKAGSNLTKGQATRERIVRETAPLMNKTGFLSTPLADILQAIGMEKGGFYHHFASKEDLALEAFEHATSQTRAKLGDAMRGKVGAVAQLRAMIEGYREVKSGKFLDGGGCPILNAAVESDDTNARLRDAARLVVDRWRGTINHILAAGIASGELRPDLDPDTAATWIISGIEGGVMLSNLYKDPLYLNRILDQLLIFIGQAAAHPA